MTTNRGVKLPAPGDPDAPKYWANETGGELGPAIERVLRRRPLTERDIEFVRAYLKQWIDSPVWDLNPNADATAAAALSRLRASVGYIQTAAAVECWVKFAADEGMDPL